MDLSLVEDGQVSLQSIIKEIEGPLSQINIRFREYVRSDNPVIQEMIDYVFDKKGKQIRPTLVFISSLIWDSSYYDDIIDLGLSIELIHIATLVHDDVNDNSELRRGIETYNKKWGKTASVLFGDFLFSRAFVILSKLGNINIIENLSRTTSQICEGEIMQSLFKKDYQITIDSYLNIIRLKTASLIAESCRVGALISFSGNAEAQKILYNFGLYLGMAFQVYDDYLDFCGDEKLTGKPVLNDIINGYITLPFIHSLNSANRDSVKLIEQIEYEKENNNFVNIVRILEEGGSLDYTKEVAKSYVAKAIDEISLLGDLKLKSLLFQIAQFVVSREY